MLNANQEKLIRSLATNKGRAESGLCLVEGRKNIKEAASFIDFTFTPADTRNFSKLVDVTTPQPIAAVARIPSYSLPDLATQRYIVVLDGVQDPGNVGAIFRLCLGFDASLVLIESADPSSPKVIRSSAGAFFHIPWLEISRRKAKAELVALHLPIIRLEAGRGSKKIKLSKATISKLPSKAIIIVGSEGGGIQLDISGTSLEIPHNAKLESLNVSHALAILLAQIY